MERKVFIVLAVSFLGFSTQASARFGIPWLNWQHAMSCINKAGDLGSAQDCCKDLGDEDYMECRSVASNKFPKPQPPVETDPEEIPQAPAPAPAPQPSPGPKLPKNPQDKYDCMGPGTENVPYEEKKACCESLPDPRPPEQNWEKIDCLSFIESEREQHSEVLSSPERPASVR